MDTSRKDTLVYTHFRKYDLVKKTASPFPSYSYIESSHLLDFYTQTRMSPKETALFSPDPPKSSTSQWLQRICVGAGLFAIGNWAASQYGTGWTSNSVFGYAKTSVGGQTTEAYDSILTEPWSQVSHLFQSVRDRICRLSARTLKYRCMANRFQTAAAEPFLRSSQIKNSYTMTALASSNAPAWMFPWTGTTPSLKIFASGSQ